MDLKAQLEADEARRDRERLAVFVTNNHTYPSLSTLEITCYLGISKPVFPVHQSGENEEKLPVLRAEVEAKTNWSVPPFAEECRGSVADIKGMAAELKVVKEENEALRRERMTLSAQKGLISAFIKESDDDANTRCYTRLPVYGVSSIYMYYGAVPIGNLSHFIGFFFQRRAQLSFCQNYVQWSFANIKTILPLSL